MDAATLLSPVALGPLPLANRLAVAPMTRVSATADGRATARMAEYYGAFARGGFGLVITEGIYTDRAYARAICSSPASPTARSRRHGGPSRTRCMLRAAGSWPS